MKKILKVMNNNLTKEELAQMDELLRKMGAC